ncbi:MAG: ZPR1 zinc finger domain-containing protein [Infirmifilum sp.]
MSSPGVSIDKISVYGKKLGEFETQCPYCGGKMLVAEVEYEIPHIGRALIVSKRCGRCGYKRNDIVPLEQRRHTRRYFKVEAPDDFEVKVVRSPTARIVIPELGLELEPGIDAEMFVTNIEGVLYLFLDALARLKALDPQVDARSVEEELRSTASQRKTGFTVVLDDVNGLSVFYSDLREPFVLVEEV